MAGRNTLDQLKVAMTFFLTMPGVPFIYYGDEIAMKYQMDLPSKEGSNDLAHPISSTSPWIQKTAN